MLSVSLNKTFLSLSLDLKVDPHDTRDHIEICPESGVVVQELSSRISQDGGYALIADYGHNGDKSDTFRVTALLGCEIELFVMYSLQNASNLTCFRSLLCSGARCSSMVSAFAHGAMGRRIDPSCGEPIKLFLVPACAP